MLMREVTVGRSKDSDIYLDDRCVYASTDHATIYYDGTQLMYKDTSSNGTMVNNIMVKHRAVPIKHGDIIMVAGRYQINWNQIDSFFPPQTRQNGNVNYPPVQEAINTYGAEPNLNKWNWGAFGLYSIWGFFNGCWWAFLIGIFFGWTIIPNIVFGIYGTRWAWQNRTWNSAADFEETQSSWAIWGIVATCLSILWVFILIASR